MKKKEDKDDFKDNRELKLQENSTNNFILMHLMTRSVGQRLGKYGWPKKKRKLWLDKST